MTSFPYNTLKGKGIVVYLTNHDFQNHFLNHRELRFSPKPNVN